MAYKSTGTIYSDKTSINKKHELRIKQEQTEFATSLDIST